METKEILQKARQLWVSEEIKSLGLEYPVADISKKMGKHTGYVSMYVSGKRPMSVSFMQAFCEAYDIDFKAVNHMLIERIQQQIKQNQDSLTKTNYSPQTVDEKEKIKNDDIHLLLTKNPTQMNDHEFIRYLAVRIMNAHDRLIDKIESVKVEEGYNPKSEAV